MMPAKSLARRGGLLRHSIGELENSLQTVTTNAPINQREGNLAQAKLEKSAAKDFTLAIKFLKSPKMKGKWLQFT